MFFAAALGCRCGAALGAGGQLIVADGLIIAACVGVLACSELQKLG